MDLEIIDFGQICRACKCVTPHLRSIFEGYQNARESPRINEMLMACTSVEVAAGDGLPSQICQICVEQLNNAFVFKRQCEKSDASLREYAKSMKVNEVKEELQSSDSESLDTSSNLLNEQQSSSKETFLDGEAPLVTPKIETDHSEFMDNIQMPLTCQRCAKIFTMLEDYRRHECIHTGKVYKCKHCDKEYMRLHYLQRHEQSHGRKKAYVCRICNKTLTRMEHLKMHFMTHLRQKPFSCKTCNRGFTRLEYLQIHTPKCKGDTVYRCDICNKNFNRENNLEVHKKTHDNQQPKLLTIENLGNIKDYYYEMDEDANLVFSDHSDVDECFEPQTGVNNSMDKDKVKEVSNITQDAESETSTVVIADNDNGSSIDDERTNESIESEMDIKEEEMLTEVNEVEDGDNTDIVKGLKVYNCKLCNKKFNRASHLQRHVTAHSTVKPFGCTLCTKSFNRKDHLNKHQKLHQRQKYVECDVCQKLFSRTYYLTKHKASKHGIGEEILPKKKYECPLCQKSFITEKNRDLHVDGHNNYKEYQCDVCKKTFLSKSSLTDHMKCHGENSKKFLCSECGQGFVRKDYLVVHMRRHRGEKPFICKYCGKGFPRSTDVIVHERRHTGEKTHLCMICGKGFGGSYNLTLHMRTHTGEKPYQCTQCDSAFAQSFDLKLHLRRHTGEKHQCEWCMKIFRTIKMLSRHKLRVHSKQSESSIPEDTSHNNEEQAVRPELPESL